MNPKIYTYIAIALVISGGIFSIYHQGYKSGLNEGKIKADVALANLANEFNNACDKNKKITENIDNEIHKNLNDTADLLNDTKLQFRTTCPEYIPVAGNTSSNNGSTERGKSNNRNEVNSETLVDFSGRCEKDRITLIAAQKFIKEVWAKKPTQ